MLIPASTIEQDGPGIDLTDQPEGYLLNMSDPVADFVYARNAVTMVYDLVGFSGVRLGFKALEYGDEPHAPPAAPFASDANFDGVAVSVDGANWYEIQDLRHLRSDKFTAYDLDLDTIMSGLGLAYGHAVRIRFCQYDEPGPDGRVRDPGHHDRKRRASAGRNSGYPARKAATRQAGEERVLHLTWLMCSRSLGWYPKGPGQIRW